MMLEIVKCKCSNCGHDFTAPSLGEGTYGEFLLWSESGVIAYLNAFEDATFKEVDNLLALHPKTSVLTPVERAKILRRVYGGLACDRDNNDSVFVICSEPPCPSCGSQTTVSWESMRPIEVQDVKLESLTHDRWNALSVSEKMALVSCALDLI
ncbi:hypothetical protein [Burkholderia ubonensis]|uniref:hypothetical protein n=1 Tax=Burkholderia ubonensis TaxID=101571 RepID=UPI0012FAA727|nr:hypothetical protein [Burkholderia ubonensis]